MMLMMLTDVNVDKMMLMSDLMLMVQAAVGEWRGTCGGTGGTLGDQTEGRIELLILVYGTF